MAPKHFIQFLILMHLTVSSGTHEISITSLSSKQATSLRNKQAHNFHSHRSVIINGHPFMTSTRRGREVRLRWTHVDGGGGPGPCGRPHRKLKLESTDIILSSSHAKKLASFYQNFVFGQKKSGNFSAI